MKHWIPLVAAATCCLGFAGRSTEHYRKQRSPLVEYVDLEATGSAPDIHSLRFSGRQKLAAKVVIEVDEQRSGQVMDGLGGAFNEQGWDALNSLPAEKRFQVLKDLFDSTSGAGLGFNRIPIGASDFALSAYSLDDTKDDWALTNFSVSRDEHALIPFIKAAQGVNPRMRFHASPWSPPGWMKTNGKQTGGGELLDDERTLTAHANYLVKFLQAYRSHDIVIDRLCPQNEPLVSGSYPGCKIPAALFGRSIREFIRPALVKAGLKTEIWAGTLNYWRQDTRAHFDVLMSDSALAGTVAGYSFQYANIGWIKEFLAAHPGTRIQHSESECYNGANSRDEACRDFQDFVAYARVGSSLFTFWNMVLPEPHESTWGWKQNSLVVIDKKKQTVEYEPSFALARLLGRHVVPGSQYLFSSIQQGAESIGALRFEPKDCVKFMQTGLAHGEQVAAFHKPDGSVVVFVLNQGPEVNAEIRTNKRRTFVTLPGNTLAAVIVQ